MAKKLFITKILWLFFSLACACQNDFLSLKNFTPPSPEASALSRYGEIPTNPSTGIPQINIPIYEIKSGSLSHSISLSYHASGIKVQDFSTPVGLGWVLNAGGEVSRNVVSIPDEYPNGILHLNSNIYNTFRNREALLNKRYNATDYVYLDDLAKGYNDSQSDIYSFNAGDISGKFVYDVDQQMQILPVDRQIKIVRNSDSSIQITSDNGTRYFFTLKQHSSNQASAGTYITSWELTKIVSATLTDSIQFFYVSANSFNESFQTHNLSVQIPIEDDGLSGCGHGTPNISYNTISNVYTHERNLLDSISFRNGYVKFQYVADRQDILAERLSTIIINSTEGKIKEIELKQSYFLSSGYSGPDSSFCKRLKLDSVKVNDKDGFNDGNTYSFGYNAGPLPAFSNVSGNPTPSDEIDYWGYYNGNGAGGYKTTIPDIFKNQLYNYLAANYYAVSGSIIDEYEDRSSNRNANPDYMKACVLEKISYPTGAYTLFEYEANRINQGYEDYSKYFNVGGLRVSKIVSFDTINRRPMIKSFVYDSTREISIGNLHNQYYQFRNITHSIAPGGGGASAGWCYVSYFTINATPYTAINYYSGSPVMYSKVSEFDGFPGLNKGKTVYSYEFEGDSSYSPDFTDKYWNFSTDRSWARGNLLAKKIYKTEGDTSILIKETKNYYSTFGAKSVKVGQICERGTWMHGSPTGDFTSYMQDTLINSPYGDRFLLNYYEYLDVVLPYGAKKLVKTEEKDYLDNTVSRSQLISYEGNDHLYPSKIATITSLGSDTITEIMKYPQDATIIYGLSDTASTALADMVTNNRLDNPVEIEQYRNAQLLTQQRITYKNWSGHVYEQYRYLKKGSALLEKRIEYKKYDDAGNPVTMSQYGGPDKSYIWGYNSGYPIAEASNAHFDEIAYTSFESADPGNWTGAGQGTDSVIALTGHRIFNLSGTITKTSLPTGKEYIISYWSRGTAATITWYNAAYTSSGTSTSSIKKAVSGWTLYEHHLPVTTANVSVAGSIIIDELRLYPLNAQMTSYTYSPLVGVTNTSGINDIVTSYSYDAFARLKCIRREDGNIIKAFDYGFSQPQGGSNPGWKPTGNTIVGSGLDYYLFVREEKDYNSSSSTYNQTRGVPVALGYNSPSWSPIGSLRCIKNNLNENTGYAEQEHIDTNRYSSLYGKKAWLNIGVSVSCPEPCTGNDKKLIDGVCEVGIKIYTGSYWDGYIWTCVYHYEWTDKSSSIDYNEYHEEGCPMDE